MNLEGEEVIDIRLGWEMVDILTEFLIFLVWLLVFGFFLWITV
jgi:hypothetical protein